MHIYLRLQLYKYSLIVADVINDIVFLVIHEDAKEAVTYILNCSSTMETKCSVSTNMVCDYKWSHLSGNFVVKNKVLNPLLCSNRCGTYQCIAECQVRGRICHVNATKIKAVYCPGMHISIVLVRTMFYCILF